MAWNGGDENWVLAFTDKKVLTARRRGGMSEHRQTEELEISGRFSFAEFLRRNFYHQSILFDCVFISESYMMIRTTILIGNLI